MILNVVCVVLEAAVKKPYLLHYVKSQVVRLKISSLKVEYKTSRPFFMHLNLDWVDEMCKSYVHDCVSIPQICIKYCKTYICQLYQIVLISTFTVQIVYRPDSKQRTSL